MPRSYRVDLPLDTSFFTPNQLQPRILLASIMNGWAGWLREHLVSFPRLLKEFRCSTPVLSAGYQHLAPLRFFEVDRVAMETRARFLGESRFAEVETICSAEGRPVVRMYSVGRVVQLSGDEVLSATPAHLPEELKQRLQADELSPDKPARPLQVWLEEVLAKGTPLATSSHELVIHRHQCEVADQWSFIEMGVFASESRERLMLEHGDKEPFLRRGLKEPLQRFAADYVRPMYLLDRGKIQTRAFRHNDRLTLVHQVQGEDGQARAIALEEM